MNTNAPFRTPTSRGGRLGVVGGYLLSELAHPAAEVGLAHDDRADQRDRPSSSVALNRPPPRKSGQASGRSTRRRPAVLRTPVVEGATWVPRTSPRATASTRSTAARSGG